MKNFNLLFAFFKLELYQNQLNMNLDDWIDTSKGENLQYTEGTLRLNIPVGKELHVSLDSSLLKLL